MSELLDDRRKALEEIFFKKQEAIARERVRLREEEQQARGALREATGIRDEEVLAHLAGLGIRAETLAALTLIPLVEVAWADGRMQAKEVEAVLSGAEATGVAKDSPSHELLRIWLEDRPAPDLVDAWKRFIAALCAELDGQECQRLRENVIGRAREVAAAAGGFLGLGSKISAEEEAVLTALGRAFEGKG